MTLEETYQNAISNGVLKSSRTFDDYKNILTDDKQRKAYWEYGQKYFPGYFPDDYKLFSVSVANKIDEWQKGKVNPELQKEAKVETPPQPASSQMPSWMNYGRDEMLGVRQAGQQAYETQEEIQRERAASDNLTPEEIQAQQEAQRKMNEYVVQNAPGLYTPDMAQPSVSVTEQGAVQLNMPEKKEEFRAPMQLPQQEDKRIPLTEENVEKMRAKVTKGMPEYLTRKNDTEENIALNTIEPWFENNPEGQAVWNKVETDVDTYGKAAQQELTAYTLFLQNEYSSGKMTLEQATKMLADKKKELNDSWEKYAEKRQNEAYSIAFDANKDRLNWLVRQLGSDRVFESAVDWKNRVLPQIEEYNKRNEDLKQGRTQASWRLKFAEGTDKEKEARAQYEKASKAADEAWHEGNLYYLAQNFIDKAQELGAAVREGKGWGAGFKEGITDISNWDFGITDIAGSYNIYNLVQKNERWEKDHKEEDKLTDAENALLQAAAIYAMSQAYNADLLSRGYKAGESSAASVPFMAQFLVMPVESIKNATARGLLRLVTRKAPTSTLRKVARREALAAGDLVAGATVGDVAAAVGLGVAGDVVAATGLTAAFGPARVASDYFKGRTGNLKADFDENGKVKFDGVDKSTIKTGFTAAKDAVVGNLSENISEILFSSFAPAVKFAAASKLFKGISTSMFGVAIKDLVNSGIGRFAKRVQWQGILAEDMEEQLNNLMRWGLTSDYKKDWEGFKKAGFNLDDEIDTFLALAPTSIVFGGMGAVGYYTPLAVNAALLRMDLQSDAEKKMFDAIMRESRRGEFGLKAHDLIRGIIVNQDLSTDAKRKMIEGVFAKYHSLMSYETNKAVEELAEERFGKNFDNLGIANKVDNAVYAGIDENGRKFFITNGWVKTKKVDGQTVVDTENSDKEFGVRYININGTLSNEMKVPNNIANGAIEASTLAEQRKFYVERNKAKGILGSKAYEVDGEYYSTETNKRLTPKEVEQLLFVSEPAVPNEQLPEGITPIDTKERQISKTTHYRIYLRDGHGNLVGEDITFASAGHNLNPDGSIDFYDENGEVDPNKLKLISIHKEDKKRVGKNEMMEYMWGLNEVLRTERRKAIADAQKKQDAKLEKLAKDKAVIDAQNAENAKRQKAISDYVASVKKDWKVKDGVIDKNAPAQQVFVWNMETFGVDEAMKRAAEDVGDNMYEIAKIEENEDMKSNDKHHDTDVAMVRINGYKEAVRKILGEQSVLQLERDAEVQVGLLLKRDLEKAEAKERARLERIEEKQRRSEENRKNYQNNLQGSEKSSNFAQNSEGNDNTGVQGQREGGNQSPQPESQQGGLDGNRTGLGVDGETQGEGRADNGRPEGRSLSITALDTLDSLNEEIDSKLSAKGIRFPAVRVIRVSAQDFHDAIAAGKQKNEDGWRVDVKSVEELEHCICILTEDGHAGIAVKEDGDIVSLFSDNTYRGISRKLLLAAIGNGGVKADFFMSPKNSKGLQNLYWRFGARITGQMLFSEEIARQYVDGWADYYDRLVAKDGEEGRKEALNHPTAAAVFPQSIDEAIDAYIERQDKMIEDELGTVELGEGQIGLNDVKVYEDYDLMMDERNAELTKTEEQEEEPADFSQFDKEPVDLTADDVVLMTSGAGGTRQTFVFARKQTDENGNVTYVSLGNPFNSTVPAAGKVLRSNWGEIDKNNKLFYVVDAEGNSIACYAYTKQDITGHKFQRGDKLNAVIATTGQPISATSMSDAYIINKNNEQVSILKGSDNGSKKVSVASVVALLDYPIFIRGALAQKGQGEISFTLRDLLYSGKYDGDTHEIRRDEEKRTVKLSAAHPYAVALGMLQEESRKVFDGKSGEYTRDFNAKLKRLFEAWNEFCKNNKLTDISDSLNKLSSAERDLFWSARAAIAGDNLNEADKASMTISTNVDADKMGYYLKNNPLHQLAVMLYIGSKVHPEMKQDENFVKLPGKSGEVGNARNKNVMHIITKDVIEEKRKRYKELKTGKVKPSAEFDTVQDEMNELEQYYPEVLNDEPIHNREEITKDNKKKVLQKMQDGKLAEAAAKEAAKKAAKEKEIASMTNEELEAKQEEIAQKAIDDTIAELRKAVEDGDQQRMAKLLEDLNTMTDGRPDEKKRVQDIITDKTAQDKPVEAPVEEQTPEQPEPSQESEQTPEQPAEQQPVLFDASTLDGMTEKQLRDRYDDINIMEEANNGLTPEQEAERAAIEKRLGGPTNFNINEFGGTNPYYQVSTDQRAKSARSQVLGKLLVRILGRINGVKVHHIGGQENVTKVLSSIFDGNIEYSADDYSSMYKKLAGLISDGWLIHGTNEDFESFDESKIQGGVRSHEGYGFYFSGMPYKPLEYGRNFRLIKKSDFKYLDSRTVIRQDNRLNYLFFYALDDMRSKLARAEYRLSEARNNRDYDEASAYVKELREEIGKVEYVLTIAKDVINNIGDECTVGQLEYNIPSNLIPSLVSQYIGLGYDGYKTDEIYTIFNFSKLNEKFTTLNELDGKENSSSERAEFFKTPKGTVYGWAIGSDIYLTDEGLNADTPIHEYTHLWVKALRANDNATWKKIVAELKRNKSLWESVTKDENYQDLKDDDAIASEVLARYVGQKGEALLEKLAKDQKFGSEKLEQAFVDRVKRTLNNFWERVARMFRKALDLETIDDFANMTLRDLFDGKSISIVDNEMLKEMDSIREEAQKNGTFMKAPNGQPTNLNERQWLLVRTKAFKKWFGDWENDPLHASKVVDENGEPLVVYHGTPTAGFGTFEKEQFAYNEGFYTTDNRKVASEYTRFEGEEYLTNAPDATIGMDAHEGVYSLFVNMRNPMVVDFADEEGNKHRYDRYPSGRWIVLADEERGIQESEFSSEEDAKIYLQQFGGEGKYFQMLLSTDDFTREAQKLGYDGCIFKNVYDGNYTIGEDMTDYVPLTPNQLKSVNNKGYFSTIDDRIEYSAAKEKAEYADRKLFMESTAQMRDMINAWGDNHLKREEKIGRLERWIVRGLDRTESLRRLQNYINAYRNENGLSPIDGKHDIRTMLESADSRISNETYNMTNSIASDFTKAWKELHKMIAKSEFYKKYSQEISPYGDREVITLTPLQLLERYLMAVDNIVNRYPAKKERGLVELEQRLTGKRFDERINREEALYFAENFVADFEKEFGIRSEKGNLVYDLWQNIKVMTDYALEKDIEGKNISQEKYEELKDKMYYVPQRGNFYQDEEISKLEEASRNDKKKALKLALESMKKAEGAKSLGSSPIAYILRDAEEAITKCELNKVRWAMFELLRDNEQWAQANGITTERVYYKKVETEELDENGEPIMETVRVTENDADYVKATTEELNERIANLEAAKETAMSDEEETAIQEEIEKCIVQLNYSLTEAETRTLFNAEVAFDNSNSRTGLEVPLIIDGVQCEMKFSPRFQYVAYALNGVVDDRWTSKIIKAVSGWLSAQFTVNNIAFPIVNITRDIAFVIPKGTAEYGIEFTGRFLANFLACQGVVARYAFGKNSVWMDKAFSPLAKEGTKGYLGEFNTQFREFLEAGANTGYSSLADIQQFKSRVMDIVPGMKWEQLTKADKTKKILRGMGAALGVLELRSLANCINEHSELVTRFAIYKSIIDMGLGQNEAVKAAHNLSVNFNRKAYGTRILNLINSLSVFANATVQGASGYWRTFDINSKEEMQVARAFVTMNFLPIALGMMNAYMNPGDGEDDYITDWDRDNYAIFGNIRIPLNEQLKPFWGIGVNAMLVLQGKRTLGEAINSLINTSLRGLVPLAPNIIDAILAGWDTKNIGYVGTTLFTPSFLQSFNQIAHNEDFMGRRVRNDMEKHLPQYMLAPNESWLFQELSYIFYKWGGGRTDLNAGDRRDMGSAYKGPEDNYEKLSPFVDVNPKQIRTYSFFIPRGALEVMGLTAAVLHDKFRGNEFGTSWTIKDVPIANRMVITRNPDAYRSGIRREGEALYAELKNPYDALYKIGRGNLTHAEIDSDLGNKELSKQANTIAKNIEDEALENFGDMSERGITMKTLEKLLRKLKETDIRKRAKRHGLPEETWLEDWMEAESPKSLEEYEKQERELFEAIDFVTKTYKGLKPSSTNELCAEYVDLLQRAEESRRADEERK